MERLFKGNSILGFLNDYVVIDTETTGHSPKYDSIIEIAAIRYSSGSEIGRYQSFINPMFLIDNFITKLTGITNDMLCDAPDAKDAIKHFIDFVGDSVIIGHNVNFDINFIYDLCESFSLRHFSNDYIDTMRLSRNLYPEDAHHRLSDLCGKFGFDYSNAHRSLIDCELTQKCYCRMNDYYESIGCSFPLQDARKEHDRLSSKSSYHLKASDITSSVECFDDDNPMFGKLFVFTGTLEKMPRKDAMQIVVDHGGSVGDSVTKKTNYLVLGDNSYCKSIRDGKSSKIKKAEKLKLDGIDIEIIPESVFYDMIL